ncbi:G antigen 10-like isoform X4 [Papio anubis]|uniref:G antigen 10-like isoform X4 n=1 Tax=Papio anubis TaxID=9555 RepID=UPI0012ADD54C|nr:G antigen 10-like isoform X4 [Papio anubis]
MSWRGRSTYRRRPRRYVEPPEMIGPMLPEQFSDEQVEPPKPEEGEPATQSQDPAPAQEGEDEGASAGQGPEPEAESQEEVRPTTDYEGPDVQEMSLPNPEEVKTPEEEMRSHCVAQAGILWLLMNNCFLNLSSRKP